MSWLAAYVRSAIARPGAAGVAALLALLGSPGDSAAFEWLDGRVQLHGFYEMQLRTISADYVDAWDVTQWYNVFNLELELDIMDDTIGPFDVVSAFIRVEARYDCIYSSGCGMFRSMDAFGDRARNAQLPRRLSNSKSNTWSGQIPISLDDGYLTRRRTEVNPDGRVAELAPGRGRGPVDLFQVAGLDTLSTQPGADLYITREATPPGNRFDDPFPYVFDRFLDYRFTQIKGLGGSDNGSPVRRMGPWLPENVITANAGLADRVNPFDDTRQSPVLNAAVFNSVLAETGDAALADSTAAVATGAGSRPFQAIPVEPEGGYGEFDSTPRGLFIPSRGLVRALDSGRIENFDDLNLTQNERAWNHGASQQQTRELKEAYLDIEMFDTRLFLRIGKQNIVWGKTELFRTTDQFNPQDLALASLPSLEESRIPLWAFRAIYSFYEVGPFEDVRLEFAFNFDEFQSADLGACGEPYTVDLVCEAAFGVWAHGVTGIGIAGIELPEDPWQDLSGWELGGRIEFRWDRFSFAISDFWGYPDIPTVDRITTYERNVDPRTGRPRVIGSRGSCESGEEAACLRPGPENSRTISSDPADPNDAAKQVPNPAFFADKAWNDGFGGLSDEDRLADPNNALDAHYANQIVFTMACSTTIGVLSLDRTACAQNALSSQVLDNLLGFFTTAQVIGSALAGTANAAALLSQAPDLPFPVTLPLVTLSRDPGDLSNGGTNCMDGVFAIPNGRPVPTCGSGGAGVLAAGGASLGERLTPQQEALLGCGPFFGVNCDDSGINLLNMEGSVLAQSFAGANTRQDLDGFRTDRRYVGDDPARGEFHQPGTVGFDGQTAVCTFGNLLRDRDRATGRDANGKRLSARKLPGCRGPGDTGFADPTYNYDLLVDGDPDAVVSLAPFDCPICIKPAPNGHPFTGQAWQSEMAAISWNFLLLTTFQDADFVDNLENGGTAYDAGVCSFVTPQYCPNLQGLLRLMGLQRNVVQAGGNGGFGRRDFQWHSGGEILIAFDKRNVLGFGMDFAEDRTEANVSLELTWINDVPVFDNDDWEDNIARTDEFNLTVSIDRPTFINFLNANRTFFFNSQWFFQYVLGYRSSFPSNGPWNILGTLSVFTGYYQDRLLPGLTLVYDVQSVSGGVLPQVTYRYNESFSVTVGAAVFFGGAQLVDMATNPIGSVAYRNGRNQFKDSVQNGLTPIRDRDEVFLRLRYTF